MNRPYDPNRAERMIRQAQGNARAPVVLRGGDTDVLRKREEMSRAQGRVLAPPAPQGLTPDLSRIVWPDERGRDGNPLPLGSKNAELAAYGYDHGKQTADLAIVIAKHLGVGYGPGGAADLKIVEGAARFHDLGRSRPWQYTDEHAALSATRAAELMHADPGLWSDPEIRDGICRLIAQHSLSGPKPSDPRAIALWDADCFESVRLAPGTREGTVVMTQRMALCITRWAREEDNQRRWQDHRGGW